MLKITRNNVNDRISNRKDRVMGILSVRQLGGLLHHLRCLMHPVCSVLSHVGSGIGLAEIHGHRFHVDHDTRSGPD